MFDFGALPPEINSGKIYSGPGSAPLLAAATAWDALASELQTTAASYASTIGELTTSWQGPSSAAASSAAAPYTAWLSSTAAQAEQTASQAQAAAGAYEAAFAASIPPPVIAANRAALALLVATNFLGQNTPAIAANEATYAEFWAQDAVAMYGYAGAATTASQLTPFTAAPATTNDTGQATQSASTAQSAAASSADATTDAIEAFLTELNTDITNFGTELSHPQHATLRRFPGLDYDPGFARVELGLATVGHERHHSLQPFTHHGRQHDQYLRCRAVVADRGREPDEELVPDGHQYPEPGCRHPGHRPLAQPQADHRGVVAAAAQRAAERLLRRRGQCRSAGVGRSGRHHRRPVGTAELGVGRPGGPDGCSRDGRDRA